MFIMSLLLLSFIVFMAALRDEQNKRKRAEYISAAPIPAPVKAPAPRKVPIYTPPGGTVENLFVDALKQHHLLIAGTTGSGKSVIENGLIDTVLKRLPIDKTGGAEMILIDSKGNELYKYRHLPHTIFYADEQESIVSALEYAVRIMEARQLEMRKYEDADYYPGSDVYVFIDEFADLMTTQAKRVKPLVQRLSQRGRSARVHVILCTQSPITDIIPTVIKCNFDARFGLRTRSAQDSRNIIEKSGLEELPTYGQTYYMAPKAPKEENRIEEGYKTVPYISKEEIKKDILHWEDQLRLNGINPDSRKRS